MFVFIYKSQPANLCLSLFKSVQEIQVGHVSFVVGINLGHELMELLLTHSETEAFKHTSEVSFSDTPIFILQYKIFQD